MDDNNKLEFGVAISKDVNPFESIDFEQDRRIIDGLDKTSLNHVQRVALINASRCLDYLSKMYNKAAGKVYHCPECKKGILVIDTEDEKEYVNDKDGYQIGFKIKTAFQTFCPVCYYRGAKSYKSSYEAYELEEKMQNENNNSDSLE